MIRLLLPWRHTSENYETAKVRTPARDQHRKQTTPSSPPEPSQHPPNAAAGVNSSQLPAIKSLPEARVMSTRKIWVKRQGASATLVKINGDDVVDDVRDMIIRKYANSLGRAFDAPDVELRILPRAHAQPHLHEGERRLGPEEVIGATLDSYYPNGQTVEEALLIEVPQRRTPKASPRVVNHLANHHGIDIEHGEAPSYFPPMSPHGQHRNQSSVGVSGQPHTISVLTTGQVPDIPSPGGRSLRNHRPKPGRTATASPTLISNPAGQVNPNTLNLRPRPHRSRASSESSDIANGRVNGNNIPIPPALPLPHPSENIAPLQVVTPPLPAPVRQAAAAAVAAAGPKGRKYRRGGTNDSPHPLTTLTRAESIPPINCLIVEDNIINLRLLEAFMRRLKVRWASAMNGKEALTKWRAGGFHLVLMDIQLPVMNGLEATKEIRRLERLNGIGAFASSAGAASSGQSHGEAKEESAGGDDQLDRGGNAAMFKSPVIIVALTASSLQSDRNEALAAGCNDFLTKPVSYPWLEQKVMEWGCMQALIDFDGWRKWKDFSNASESNNSAKSGGKGKAKLVTANGGGGIGQSSNRASPSSGGKHKKRHGSGSVSFNRAASPGPTAVPAVVGAEGK